MKTFLTFAFLATLLMTPATAQSRNVYALNASLNPGINLGNSLEVPADGSWTGVAPTPRVIDRIAESGFASVRLPIRWSDYAPDRAPYTIDEDFFEIVDRIVDRALQHDLKVIVNIHHFDEFYDDPDTYLSKFLALWTQISLHYQDYPYDLIFEILNEPRDPMTHEIWSDIYPQALRIIRQTNPDRAVMIGGANWGGWESIVRMDLPRNDPNIIATFHYYLPFPFTHQGASWTNMEDQTGVPFDATVMELAQIDEHFDKVAAWALQHGYPVNVGEFGAYSAAQMEDRIRYTHTIRTMCEAHGFSWHYWEFGSGFGIWDPETDTYREGLKGALLK